MQRSVLSRGENCIFRPHGTSRFFTPSCRCRNNCCCCCFVFAFLSFVAEARSCSHTLILSLLSRPFDIDKQLKLGIPINERAFFCSLPETNPNTMLSSGFALTNSKIQGSARRHHLQSLPCCYCHLICINVNSIFALILPALLKSAPHFLSPTIASLSTPATIGAEDVHCARGDGRRQLGPGRGGPELSPVGGGCSQGLRVGASTALGAAPGGGGTQRRRLYVYIRSLQETEQLLDRKIHPLPEKESVSWSPRSAAILWSNSFCGRVDRSSSQTPRSRQK